MILIHPPLGCDLSERSQTIQESMLARGKPEIVGNIVDSVARRLLIITELASRNPKNQ
jgi:hypothetical protein